MVIFPQRVERVEKFLLRGFLARDELNIVHQKQVRAAVFVAELDVLPLFDRLDQLVRELIALDVHDVVIGVRLAKLRRNGVQQVRFAEPRRTVNEQRIVGIGGLVRHRQRRRVGKAVRRADHERIECELRIAVHKIARAAAVLEALQLVLAQNDELRHAVKQLRERPADVIAAARADKIAPERRGRIQNEPFFRQLDDLRVVKPGRHDLPGQPAFHIAQDARPNIRRRVHRKAPFFSEFDRKKF